MLNNLLLLPYKKVLLRRTVTHKMDTVLVAHLSVSHCSQHMASIAIIGIIANICILNTTGDRERSIIMSMFSQNLIRQSPLTKQNKHGLGTPPPI